MNFPLNYEALLWLLFENVSDLGHLPTRQEKTFFYLKLHI